MAITTLEAEEHLPYAARDLHRLVADIHLYPSFIPWLKTLRILREQENGPLWEAVAQAHVGWRAISETFTTRVRSDRAAGLVHVSLVEGPFRHLENRWRFAKAPEGGARVHFWIAYEFKNPLLNALARVNRETASRKIMAAFAAEAARRYPRAEA